MFEWIANNAVTIITIFAVTVLVGVAVFTLVKDKKRSAGGCSGGCSGCSGCCSGCSHACGMMQKK
ncbi:MAG: FeoB-associated Cys-rich membrane protein [Clostridia bacterium]|nr:FeoB-associated Cys-rich membrane protein [Clostridia bacterium]